MHIWRLSRARHLDTLPLGESARRFGGRWNSPGRPCVYTSESLEIALLEALVHVNLEDLPDDLIAVHFELPDALIISLEEPLPPDWDAPPPYRPPTRTLGDRWLASRATLALRVPASVLPRRCNVLLNSQHAAMSAVREISREPLPWPKRLMAYLARKTIRS